MRKMSVFFPSLILALLLAAACDTGTTNTDTSITDSPVADPPSPPVVSAVPDTWTAISDAGWTAAFGTGDVYKVAAGGGLFIAGGAGGNAARSSDGITWTAIKPNPTGAQLVNGIAYGGGRFIIVGANNSAAWSSDGITWTPITGLNIGNIYAVCHGTVGGAGRFIMAGDGGRAAFSNNGSTWTELHGSGAPESIFTSGTAVRGITYGNGLYVATGGNQGASFVYRAAYSADCVNWHDSSAAVGIYSKGIAYGNGIFITVGFNSAEPMRSASYSVNGTSWIPVPSDAVHIAGSMTGWVNNIAYGGSSPAGYFVAGGVEGKMSYTQDGATWTAITATTFTDWVNGIACGTIAGGARFIAVGDVGKGAYCTVGE
ncbi:hypothetical protein AGMMS49942_28350 [Spirochaetia bacterium]|nr:hypothetical protein AGMMS49942_28350 [Spirochaetia bacterium]